MSAPVPVGAAPGRPCNDSPKRGAACGIKLVQYRPAWSYHCLLRFKGLAYTAENAILPVSMGKTLPCLIDGNYVVNGQHGLEHLIDNALGDDNTEGDISNLEDFAYAAYIESHLAQVLTQIKNILNYDRHEILTGHSFINTWMLCIYRNIYSYFHQEKKQIVSYYDNSCVNYRYETFNVLELEDKLHRAYRVLDGLLLKHSGYLSASLKSRKQRGIADAVLFDHLVNIFLIERSKAYTKNILSLDEGVPPSKYGGIHSFYRSIMQEYFYNNTKTEHVQAVQTLLNNQFLKYNNKLNGDLRSSWEHANAAAVEAAVIANGFDEAVKYSNPVENLETPEPCTTLTSQVYSHLGRIYLGVVVSVLTYSYIKSVNLKR